MEGRALLRIFGLRINKDLQTMNVIASMQPSHAIGDLHFAHKRLGEDRLE